MPKPSFLCLGLTSTLLALGSLSPLQAAPLVLTPSSVPGTYTSDFSSMFGVWSHTDTFTLSFSPTVSESGVTDSVTWEVLGDKTFVYSPGSAYNPGANLFFNVVYTGAILDNESAPVQFTAAPAFTFIGLEGAEQAQFTGNVGVQNTGTTVSLYYQTIIPNVPFSFTGFSVSLALPDGNHTVNLAGLSTSFIYINATTFETTDPGPAFTYQTIPEPSSIALFAGIGAAGLAWRGLRRRKAAAQR